MIDIEQQNLEQERAEAAAVAGDARLNVALPEAPESERWLLCLLLNALQDGTIGEAHDPETHLIPLAIDAAIGRRSGMPPSPPRPVPRTRANSTVSS